MSDTTPSAPPPWWPLAEEALLAARAVAIAERPADRTVSQPVSELALQFGSDVLLPVMLTWIDAALAYSGYKPGGNASIAWQNLEDGQVQGADEVPPGVRWAGRAFIARTNNDEAMFRALCDSAETIEQWSNNVLELLLLCGRFLHRGIKTTPVNPLIRRNGRGDQ